LNRKLAVGLVAIGIIIASFWIFFSTTMCPSVSVPQIFIRSDGSIEPSSPPLQRDGDTYSFLDTVREEIVVQKNNVVIDGKGLTLDITIHKTQGGSWWEISNMNNITIRHIIAADHNHLTPRAPLCDCRTTATCLIAICAFVLA